VRATRLLFRGQRQRRAGQYADAVETLRRAADAAPDSPHVTLHRALALADAGDADRALDTLSDGARRWPENPVFPLFQAAVLIEADRLEEADAPLDAARQLSPRNRLVSAYAAIARMRRGEMEDPLRHLGAVGLTDNPRALAAILTEVEADLYRRFGANTNGSPPPDEAVPPDPRMERKSAPRLAAAGKHALENGDPARAHRLLSLAAAKNPSLPELQAHLGCSCFDLGRYEEALDHLSRVGDWSTMLDVVHLHRGASLYKLGRLGEAVVALEAALTADEAGEYAMWIRFFQGRALAALGRREDARAALRRFVELEGDMALARLEQARELLGLAVSESAPPGFESIPNGNGTLVVRPEYAEAVAQRRPAEDGGPAKQGRGAIERIALPDGVGLVRRLRHGGLLGGVLRSVYLDGKRFLREMGVAEALSRRGVPTPQVIAGLCRPVLPRLYRMEVVTREVPGAEDLAAALQARPQAAGEALTAAARLLAHLHRVGLDHPDLNARNILLPPDGTAMIIDLDKADMADSLPACRRAAMAARLYRSLCKLGLVPDPVRDERWLDALKAYLADAPDLDMTPDELLARCHRDTERHRLWWRLTGTGQTSES
jgi:tetratricopeptide (TPR) repeat protein